MLTQEMNALAHEIAMATDVRLAAMAKLRKSSRTERDARMAAMSRLRRALRAELARQRRQLASQDVERRAAARRLHVELARNRRELAKSEAARAAGVKTRMRAITADRVGAHGAWRDLTVTLHGKRVAAAASARKPAAAPAAPAEPAPAAKAE